MTMVCPGIGAARNAVIWIGNNYPAWGGLKVKCEILHQERISGRAAILVAIRIVAHRDEVESLGNLIDRNFVQHINDELTCKKRSTTPKDGNQLMMNSTSLLRTRTLSVLGSVVLFAATALTATAQRPEARILAPVDNSVRAALAGTKAQFAEAGIEAGRMAATTQLQQMTIHFSRSATQQAALDALIQAQQNPASPQYHQWLEPDQFAAQFGAADADIAKVQTWLASQGFSVGEVSRNRSEITFSGSIAQVEAAFATEMHYFMVGGEKHFGPSIDVSVPAAFSSAVLGVGHLSDWKPRAHSVKIDPHFTSSQTGSNFVQPGDVAVIYDIAPAYSAGYTGNGQTIAVMGQSNVVLSDISNFQTAAGVPVRAPNVILMPGTGTSQVFTGDESESDLDLEYSSGIAKGATILFVYTGNNPNYGVFDALDYTISNKLAPIISISYGGCEANLGQTIYQTVNGYLQQAAAQGQSVVASAGDSGSLDCYGDTALTSAVQAAPAVDFPASSQYVTGLGGTEYLAADVAKGNTTYWQAQSTSDIIASAKSYIPEQAWNDDTATSGLSSGGGGVSIFTAQPSWQTGVPGITAGSFRLVPDIALASSPNNAGYLYCSSDRTTGITGSCSNGFRDSSNSNLTVVGGTSVATPIVAGMLAIINQKTNTTYAGVVNAELYKLASTPATYASAFHDINTGNNGCVTGTTYPTSFNTNGTVATYGPACPSATAGQFAATTGYDEATGLGSVDLYNLMTAWPNGVPLTGSTMTVTPATLTPVQNVGDVITFKVASASGTVTTVPTGTIALSIDGTYSQALTLSGGTATYTFTSSSLGAHVISAVYSGDTVFSTSTGTTTVTVVTSNTSTSISAATTPAVVGTADAITITVSGTGAPTGSVSVTVSFAGSAISTSTVTLTPGSSNSSTATYSFVAPTTSGPGTYSIAAAYQGNGAAFQQSGTTLTLVGKSPGSFTLAAAAVTVTDGSTTTATVNVTPTGGYFGLTNLTLSTTATIGNACYTLTNPTISGTAVVPVSATIYTNGANCPSGALALLRAGGARASNEPPARPGGTVPAGLAMAGLLAIGFAGRRNRKLRGLVAVAVIAIAGFAMSGCGSTSTAGAGLSTTAAKGTYTVTVSGTDAATGTISATPVTFSLTIQ